MNMKKLIIGLALALALQPLAGATQSKKFAWAELPFPFGIVRGAFTICETPVELPRAMVMCLTSADNPATGVLAVPFGAPIIGAASIVVRAVVGTADVLTFGFCDDAIYSDYCPPLIWEARWVLEKKDAAKKGANEGKNAGRVPSEKSVSPAPTSEEPRISAKKEPSYARDKAKLVGEWQCTVAMKTKVEPAIPGKPGEVTLSTTLTYQLYGDGVCACREQCNGKEGIKRGTWGYQDGELVITTPVANGNVGQFALRLIWYSDVEFEARYADLANLKAERKTAGVSFSDAWYDNGGTLRTIRIMTVKRPEGEMKVTVNSDEGAMIFRRIGDVAD